MSTPSDLWRVRAGYDIVADAYAATFGDEVRDLPLDAGLIDRIGVLAAGGPVLEVGAGVGPVARRLSSSTVVCLDLSSAMLAHAPRSAGRVQGEVERLPFRKATFAAVVVRYVLQHVPRERLPAVVSEVRRCTRRGGWVLVAVHLGEGAIELTEMLGERFEPMVGAFHGREEVQTLLDDGGFTVTETLERGPVGAEAPTQRLYVLAQAR